MGSKPRAFKHQLGPGRVVAIADLLAEASEDFDRDRFVADATTGLEALELKARVQHIVDALACALPQPFPRAIATILEAVAIDGARREGDARHLRGFAAWPLTDYVGEHGLGHLELSLSALRVLTGRFSAEFAIRPFLDQHPRQTLAQLRRWTDDPDHHVRRLVSEGTRPLLPWGRNLRRFRDDPTPVIELLERLATDPSEYVRRSIANNLNDIAKDHPELVIEIGARWWPMDGGARQWMVKRALRTLVKRGNPAALAVLGFGASLAINVGALSLEPRELREGGSLELRFDITSQATTSQRLNIDYAVHFVKASGERSPKVFKLKTMTLAAAETQTVRKTHSMKRVTTRVHHRGRHTVEILINGQSRGQADFELVAV